MSERIEEWHRRNPNQLATVTLLNTIELSKTSNSSPLKSILSKPAFQLSTTDRIATIEAELFNLRARHTRFSPVVRTRAQKARSAAVEVEEEEEEDAAAVRAARQPQIVEVRDVDETRPEVSEEAQPVPEPAEPAPQVVTAEHPYRNAKDAAYAPPSDRNLGAPIKPPATSKRNEAAYKTLPPVHDPSIATEVYKRSMEAPVTITQRELLSLSPEVRSQVREVTTTRRIPNNSIQSNPNILHFEKEPGHRNISEEHLPDDDSIEQGPEQLFSSPGPGHGRPCCVHSRIPPRGAIILDDPIDRYYRSLSPGEVPDPDRLIIAKESSAVRSIFAVIDSSKRKECILDPGCQIVAMSEDTCHELALVYDPAIKLNMQSANGTTDWSLGMARNVPFTIGSITLYMQVHIIGSPAYDILLGRPFDILTESIVRNFSNEDQTVTITDPNTAQRYTVPTFPRGRLPSVKISNRVFRF
jgi:hypothetical protein